MFTKIQHHVQNQIVHQLDGTKITDDNFELYAEFLVSLTREQFNNFRQEDMKRLYNMSRPSHIEPHTHEYIYWAYQVKCNFRITNCP